MASGEDFQEQLSGPAFLSEPDSHLFFGDDATILDVPDKAVDSRLHTGSLYYDIFENALPMLPSDITTNASYGDAMLTIAAPVFPSTQEVNVMPDIVIPLHLSPHRIASKETGDVKIQEAPEARVRLEVPDETTKDTNTTGLISFAHSRYTTAEDWERHRVLFTRLYRDENKTLKEVKSIMEKYGFNAT